MHSDGPDCGCWNLIYGPCSASDGQPMGSGQEMGMQVSVDVCLGALYYICCSNVCMCVCVSLSACLLLALTVCLHAGGG